MIRKFIPGEVYLVKKTMAFLTPSPRDVIVGEILSVVSVDEHFVNFIHPAHGLLTGWTQTKGDYEFWNESLICLVSHEE